MAELHTSKLKCNHGALVNILRGQEALTSLQARLEFLSFYACPCVAK